MADQKLNWRWDGFWSTSGNGVWTATMSELQHGDPDGKLPGTNFRWKAGFPNPWADFRWNVVRSETHGNDIDLWEVELMGTKFIIFND